MRGLVAACGATLPDLPAGELLAWLDAFSAAHWDFRAKAGGRTGGVERDQVGDVRIAPDVERLVGPAAAALGLVEPREPTRDRYDHLLVLGGLAPACLQRTAHAAYLLDRGLTVGDTAALGSFRPLGDHEKAVLRGTAPVDPSGDPVYEVDAVELGVRRAFPDAVLTGQRGSDGTVGRLSWRVDTYRHPATPRVDVVAAPARTGRDRANTPDTYAFWAETEHLRPGDRVLVVTSPLYVPFQHCDAVRLLGLPYRCTVETVGFDASVLSGVPATPPVGADCYLQEIRSAIRSMRDLFAALPA